MLRCTQRQACSNWITKLSLEFRKQSRELLPWLQFDYHCQTITYMKTWTKGEPNNLMYRNKYSMYKHPQPYSADVWKDDPGMEPHPFGSPSIPQSRSPVGPLVSIIIITNWRFLFPLKIVRRIWQKTLTALTAARKQRHSRCWEGVSVRQWHMSLIGWEKRVYWINNIHLQQLYSISTNDNSTGYRT